MSTECEIGHRGVIHDDAFQSKTIGPEIGGDGQSERIKMCIGMIGICNPFIDSQEMTVVIEDSGEVVAGVFGNRNGRWRRVCGCGRGERHKRAGGRRGTGRS